MGIYNGDRLHSRRQLPECAGHPHIPSDLKRRMPVLVELQRYQAELKRHAELATVRATATKKELDNMGPVERYVTGSSWLGKTRPALQTMLSLEEPIAKRKSEQVMALSSLINLAEGDLRILQARSPAQLGRRKILMARLDETLGFAKKAVARWKREDKATLQILFAGYRKTERELKGADMTLTDRDRRQKSLQRTLVMAPLEARMIVNGRGAPYPATGPVRDGTRLVYLVGGIDTNAAWFKKNIETLHQRLVANPVKGQKPSTIIMAGYHNFTAAIPDGANYGATPLSIPVVRSQARKALDLSEGGEQIIWDRLGKFKGFREFAGKTSPLTTEMAQQARDDLAGYLYRGAKVLVVAHSQGCLLANEMFKLGLPTERVQVIYLASPVALPHGLTGSRIYNVNDPLRLANAGPGDTLVAPPPENGLWQTMTFKNHQMMTGYLSGPPLTAVRKEVAKWLNSK